MKRIPAVDAPHACCRLYWLLRQRQLALYAEGLGKYRYAGVRLAAADRNCVHALGDYGDAVLSNHAQVTRLQLKAQALRSAGIETNALEGAQCPERRAGYLRKAEIELSYFVARALAGISDSNFRHQRATRSYRVIGDE